MASPNLKRPLSSRPRQRGSPRSSKIRELDKGQIVFVFSVEGMVTLELASSATRDPVPRPLFRARDHRLSRLKEALFNVLLNFISSWALQRTRENPKFCRVESLD